MHTMLRMIAEPLSLAVWLRSMDTRLTIPISLRDKCKREDGQSRELLKHCRQKASQHLGKKAMPRDMRIQQMESLSLLTMRPTRFFTLERRDMNITAVRSIYVMLVDEGIDVWRPVDADKIDDRVFRIRDQP